MSEIPKSVKVASTVASSLLAVSCLASGESVSVRGEQFDQLNNDLRLGRLGIEAYEELIGSTDDFFVSDSVVGLKESNVETFEGMSLPFGKKLTRAEKLTGEEVEGVGRLTADDAASITVYSTEAGTFLEYKEEWANKFSHSDTFVAFSNPDNDMFGDDEEASLAEMRRFYEDENTTVAQLSYSSSDIMSGEEKYEIRGSRNSMSVKASKKDGRGDDVSLGLNVDNAPNVIKDELYLR